MRISRLSLALVALVGSFPTVRAQAPDRTGPSHPDPAPDRVLADVTRWNDRSTPRKTLETLYFSIIGYDRSPGLIVNAIDCLDLDGLDPEMRERDAALLAHQLDFILN